MAPTPDGGGYWLVASDGGIFSYGGAPFYGSLGGSGLSALGMIVTPANGGYSLVTSDGSAQTFLPAASSGASDPGVTTAPSGTTATTSTTTSTTPQQNLLADGQTTFNETTGGWVGSNAILSSSQPSGAGSSALQVTAAALSWVAAWSALPPSGTPTPREPWHQIHRRRDGRGHPPVAYDW